MALSPPPNSLQFFTYLAITISFFLIFPMAESGLDVHYYENSCPRFNDIVGEVVTEKMTTNPTVAGAILRLFFHDCVVHGCDASILIAANQSKESPERDHDINQSLTEDSFVLVNQIKTALELECPNVVSCADILAAASRNLVTMVGGPLFELSFGRRDGRISKASEVEENIPRPTSSMPRLKEILVAKSLTVQEIVALSGAHTIGFSHCKQFSDRIFNFSTDVETDTRISTKYATGLRQLCMNYSNDPTIAAFNDVMTPKKFDNLYYSNVLNGLGLLATDQGLLDDPEMRKFVEKYAVNQTAFFDDFANAMKKLSELEVNTEHEGEIRHKCDAFNDHGIETTTFHAMDSLFQAGRIN